MNIDKDIDNLLKEIKPEPQVIKNLVDQFIWEVMWTEENVNVPIGIDQYRTCLLESKESLVAYLSRERIGFIDELKIGHLWDYRAILDQTFKPQEGVIYLIACRKFLKFCHARCLLDQEIAENMQFVKDNALYVAEMDPMAFDLSDIL
jgi:hypothetical protein